MGLRGGWRSALRRAAYVGSVASAVSTWVISRRSSVDSGAAASGTNSTSHWLWDEIAHHQRDVSARYTGVGYAIHHASAVFWALIYERYFPSAGKSAGGMLADSAKVAVIAAGTDYLLTPPCLRPGFERHLSLPSMVMVYVGFGAGLATGRYLWERRSR